MAEQFDSGNQYDARDSISRLLTVDEVAKTFNLSPKTIRNWISARKIPYVQIGHRAMFRPQSVDLWIKKKEVKVFQ